MIVLRKFQNKEESDNLRNTILEHSKYFSLKPFQSHKIGLYARVSKRFINIMDVSEDTSISPESYHMINMHFYGWFFTFMGKCYLIGIFLPGFLLTLFTFLSWFDKSEYIGFKIGLLSMWFLAYILNFKRIGNLYNLLFSDTGED